MGSTQLAAPLLKKREHLWMLDIWYYDLTRLYVTRLYVSFTIDGYWCIVTICNCSFVGLIPVTIESIQTRCPIQGSLYHN